MLIAAIQIFQIIIMVMPETDSIEAVEVYYYTPDTLLYNEGPHYQAFTENGYKYAYYRVSTTGNDYFPYQTDNERNDGQDGYAGIYGRKVDRFQIVIK